MKCMFLTTLLMLVASTANAQLINEFQPNPIGGDPDTQTIEISGTPGASFTDLTFLTIEAEGTTTGNIDRATTFSGTFDANGLFTVDVTDLENPAFTAILASDFAAATGDDVDVDDDGTIDPGLFTVLDSIAIQDDGSGDTFFSTTIVPVPEPSVASEPFLVFRGPGGDFFAAYTSDDGLVILDMDGASQDLADFGLDATSVEADFLSFGSANPGVPTDSVLLGDVNLDGTVSFLDISPFIIALLSNGDFQDQADINEDGSVDFLDISPFIVLLSSAVK